MGSIWPIVHKYVTHSWFCGLYLVACAVYLRHCFPQYLSCCCCLVYLSWIFVTVLANWFVFIMDVKEPIHIPYDHLYISFGKKCLLRSSEHLFSWVVCLLVFDIGLHNFIYLLDIYPYEVSFQCIFSYSLTFPFHFVECVFVV